MAVKKTPNYSLNKPDKGTRDYDVLLNQNADIVDTQLKVANDNLTAGLKVANDKNIATEERVTTIVAGAGASNTEILDARLGVDGVAEATLKARLDKMQTQLVDSERQSTTLSTGVAVVNALANAPARVEIEGQTLISLPNTPLETGKKYVLADKKAKVIVDGVTHTGVAKFTKTGESGRATIIRVADFEGKIGESVVESPHKAMRAGRSSLEIPSGYQTHYNQANIDQIKKLDGAIYNYTQSADGIIAQNLFSFNLIEAVERNIGRIPRTTVADKVAWLKANVTKLTGNWHGFGSSVGGNKVTLSAWRDGVWTTGTISTSSSITKVTLAALDVTLRIQNDGFVHFLAYAEPSDGIIPSVINTDYIELEIELKPDADFTHPKVPLYEVADESYNKILVDWDADEVVRRYPAVENGSGNHLQGVGVFAEGEQILPPYTESYRSSGMTDVDIISVKPYEFSLKATTSTKWIIQEFNVIPNQNYTLFLPEDTPINVSSAILDTNGSTLIIAYSTARTRTFNAGNRTRISLYLSISNSGGNETVIKNPMLTLGATAKPFVPKNTSYVIADVKLGAIGTVKDTLAPGDNKTWLLTKRVEKDVVLDGSLAWTFESSKVGFKTFRLSDVLKPYFTGVPNILITDKGKSLKQTTSFLDLTNTDIVWFSSTVNRVVLAADNAETGFIEGSTPTASDIKRYFNGWKYSDGTTWTSVTGNGQTATAQEALDTKPTDYTPYKLSYVLATPQTIDVTDKVEGSLKVNGLTQVEVMSGVIRREKVVPHLNSGIYYINRTSAPSSLLKRKVKAVIKVYKNGTVDNTWVTSTNNIYGGSGGAFASAVDFDPTAEYTVTYIALDKHLLTANPTNVKLTYAQNLQTAVKDMNDGLQDNSTSISILNKLVYDLLVQAKAGV